MIDALGDTIAKGSVDTPPILERASLDGVWGPSLRSSSPVTARRRSSTRRQPAAHLTRRFRGLVHPLKNRALTSRGNNGSRHWMGQSTLVTQSGLTPTICENDGERRHVRVFMAALEGRELP